MTGAAIRAPRHRSRRCRGASFIVNGARAPNDLALVTTGVEFKLSQAVTFSAKFDGEFASDFQSYAGTGTLRYSW